MISFFSLFKVVILHYNVRNVILKLKNVFIPERDLTMWCLKNPRNLMRFSYRTVSGTRRIKDKEKIEPVDLAYASYESTDIGYGATPVVIMHGLLGSKNNWNSLSKAFHQKTIPQRKIVAVDARNHGDSPHTIEHTYDHLVEDIKQLLQRLKISKACLLGHSMGGRAMMLFALKYVCISFCIFRYCYELVLF